MRILIRSLSVSAALALIGTGQAQAHAHLLSATPPADARLYAAPIELQLRFSEGLELRFTGVTLSLNVPAGSIVPTGAPRLGSGDDTLLVVPISGGLASGAYTVEWHALSADGHKTQGRYAFIVKP